MAELRLYRVVGNGYDAYFGTIEATSPEDAWLRILKRCGFDSIEAASAASGLSPEDMRNDVEIVEVMRPRGWRHG